MTVRVPCRRRGGRKHMCCAIKEIDSSSPRRMAIRLLQVVSLEPPTFRRIVASHAMSAVAGKTGLAEALLSGCRCIEKRLSCRLHKLRGTQLQKLVMSAHGRQCSRAHVSRTYRALLRCLDAKYLRRSALTAEVLAIYPRAPCPIPCLGGPPYHRLLKR